MAQSGFGEQFLMLVFVAGVAFVSVMKQFKFNAIKMKLKMNVSIISSCFMDG